MQIPVETYTLPNGLRVILSEDHATPVVAVNLWYHVGSANERAGRTGFAHLFEHMLFQGSANVGANEHFELVQRAGGLVTLKRDMDGILTTLVGMGALLCFDPFGGADPFQ